MSPCALALLMLECSEEVLGRAVARARAEYCRAAYDEEGHRNDALCEDEQARCDAIGERYGAVDEAREVLWFERLNRDELQAFVDLWNAEKQAMIDAAIRDDGYEQWKRENVTRDPEMCGGEPTLRGSRTRVRFFGECFLEWSLRDIAAERRFRPELTDDDVKYMMAFARTEPLEEAERR